MTYDSRMDPECIPLCDALNALPGIETWESCCGHTTSHFRIYFSADKIESLKPITWAIYHRRNRWNLEVSCINHSGWNIYFMLEGLPGLFKEADEIAVELGEWPGAENA